MFVRGVRAVAVDAESVENRDIQSRRKIAVRCAADRTLLVFKSELRSNLARLLI
jgi:hypothetical protein